MTEWVKDASYYIYTVPDLNNSYSCNPVRDTTVLDNSAYFITKGFIENVFQGHFLPESILETFDLQDPDVFIQELADNWNVVISYNWRVCVSVVFGFIMTLLIPALGIVWCVGRCKGHGGAETRPWSSSRSAKLKRQLSYTLFLVFWPLCMWAIAWNLQADVIFGAGMQKLPGNVGNIIGDTLQYVDNAVAQVDHWAEANFLELRVSFNTSFELMDETYSKEMSSKGGVRRRIAWDRKDLGAQQTLQLSTEYKNGVQDDILAEMDMARAAFDEVNRTLASFKELLPDLYSNPNLCPDTTCDELETRIDKELVMDDEPLGDKDYITNFEITPEEFTAMQELVDFSEPITILFTKIELEILQPHYDEILGILSQANEWMEQEVEEYIRVVDNLAFEDPEVVSVIQEGIDDWYDVLFWCFQIPAYIMIVVLVLYLIGFIMGVLGHVDDRNKKHGADLICTGSGIFFSMSLVLWLFTTCLFVCGGSVQKLGCDMLIEPETSDLYLMFERDINEQLYKALNTTEFANVTWNLPEMLYQCQDDQSLYQILKLDQVYDLEQLRAWVNVTGADLLLGQLSSEVNSAADDILARLTLFEDDYSQYEGATNLTAVKWAEMWEFMRQIKDQPNDYDYIPGDILEFVESSLNDLYDKAYGTADEALVTGIIDQYHVFTTAFDTFIEEDISDYTDKAADYKDSMLLDDGSRKLMYDMLISFYQAPDEDDPSIVETVKYLSEEGLDVIKEELPSDYTDVMDIIDGFVQHTIDYMGTELGRCEPAYNIYESMINYGCYEIVDPVNSIWSGLGAVLLMFVPLLLINWHLELTFRSTKKKQQQDTVSHTEFSIS